MRINISRENIGFGAMEFCIYGLFCVTSSYFIMYFREIGYGAAQIGVMVSATYILNMAAQMAAGYLSDFIISVKKIFIFTLVLSVVVALLIRVMAGNYLLLFLLYAVYSVTGGITPSVVDTYAARQAKRRSGLDFSFVRGFGSIGYALVSLLLGWLIARIGYNSVFAAHFTLAVCAISVLFRLEDVPLQTKKREDGVSAANTGYLSALAKLSRTKGYILTVIACVLTFVGASMVGTYCGYVIPELGGTSEHVGLAMFCVAVIEVPVFWGYRHISRRFSERGLIMFAFLMFPLKPLIVLVFFSVNGIIASQLTQCLSYAVYVPTMMRFMGKIIPRELITTGMMIWLAATGALAGTLSSYFGGVIIDAYGAYYMYLSAAVCTVLGAALIAVMLFRTRGVEGQTS